VHLGPAGENFLHAAVPFRRRPKRQSQASAFKLSF
jgi:hypothetical protein